MTTTHDTAPTPALTVQDVPETLQNRHSWRIGRARIGRARIGNGRIGNGRIAWRRDPALAAELTPRRYLSFFSLLLLAGALVQRPGKIVADTKVALTLNPGQFLSGALHLWNPLSDSGSVSDQSTGYLMPMGPFYLLTHSLGIAPAVAQRLWLAFLLVAAFWGTVRLADALGIGNRTGRVLGGLAYAVSPFVMARIGDNSALVLGGVFLPLALLPLVRATYQTPGSVRAPLSPRRAAALSGCAVVLMSGVNAIVTLEALIPPALWLLLMCRGRRAWVLRAWWAGAVVCAIAWWFVALRAQSQYGIDFLKYTESASTTTSVTSLPETLRGTADWLAYFRLDGVLLPSAWTYISATAAVVASYVLLGLGLVGLSRPHVPAKRFLLVCLGLGVLGVAAGYPGHSGGIFADTWRHALSGPLGAFRNTNKFQPLIRLPIALGLAHCLPVFLSGAGARLRRWRIAANAVAALTLLAAVVLGAAPLGLSRIYPAGGFASVPQYWQDAASWLAHNATASRTLLAPASGTGDYTWGNPNDEPLLWLSKTAWAVRNVIPLGGVNSTRLLDAIETQYSQRSAPGLPETLARSGVGFVLVRNDLPRVSADQPPSTDEIRTALTYGGMQRVASFGPLVMPRLSGIQLFLHQKPTTARIPAIEIYAGRSASKVDSYPTSALAVLSGGPEAIPTLEGANLLGNRPTVLAVDTASGGDSVLPKSVSPTAWIDTDTLDRRDEQYGILHGGGAVLLSAGEQPPGQTADPNTRLDLNPVGHQTVAAYRGISSITASAYGTLLGPVEQSGPQAAVDSDPGTSWSVSGFSVGGRGQWLQLTLPAARALPYVTVQVESKSPKRPRITGLRVTTSAGSILDTLRDTPAPQRIAVPAGPTDVVRLTIADLHGKGSLFYGPGIEEVALPGIAIARDVVLPDDVRPVFGATGAPTLTYIFNRDRVDPRTFLDFDAEHQIDRVINVPRTTDFFVAATAVTRATSLPPKSTRAGIVSLACGSGPSVIVDGKAYATYLRGSAAHLLAGQPIPLGLCTSHPLRLTTGTHRIRTAPSPHGDPLIGVATLSLTNQVKPPQASTSPARTASITTWGDEKRKVLMSAGPSSILAVHENFSLSWQATFAGKPLAALRLDGWQQAFIVPAGAAGTVILTNKPGATLRAELTIAAGLLLALIVAALWPGRRTAEPIHGPRSHGIWLSRLAALLLAAGITVLVAGPVVTAYVPALAAAVWLSRRFAPMLTVAGVAVAAAVALDQPARYAGTHQGAFSTLAQTASALALAAAVLSAGNRSRAASKAVESALGTEEEVVHVAAGEQHVGEQPTPPDGLGELSLVALDVEVGEGKPPPAS